MKRASLGAAASRNSCILAELPTPSKEKRTNCGAFSPGASLVIGMLVALRPDGSTGAELAGADSGDEALVELSGADVAGSAELVAGGSDSVGLAKGLSEGGTVTVW